MKNTESMEFVDEQVWWSVHSDYDELPITPEAYRVFGHIKRRAGKKNEAYPCLTTIGEKCFRHANPNASQASLKAKAVACIKELLAIKVIRDTGKTGSKGQKIYAITNRPEWQLDAALGEVDNIHIRKGRPGQTRKSKKAEASAGKGKEDQRLTPLTPPVNPVNPPQNNPPVNPVNPLRLTPLTPPVNPVNPEGIPSKGIPEKEIKEENFLLGNQEESQSQPEAEPAEESLSNPGITSPAKRDTQVKAKPTVEDQSSAPPRNTSATNTTTPAPSDTRPQAYIDPRHGASRAEARFKACTGSDGAAERNRACSRFWPALVEQGLSHLWVGPARGDFAPALKEGVRKRLLGQERPSDSIDVLNFIARRAAGLEAEAGFTMLEALAVDGQQRLAINVAQPAGISTPETKATGQQPRYFTAPPPDDYDPNDPEVVAARRAAVQAAHGRIKKRAKPAPDQKDSA